MEKYCGECGKELIDGECPNCSAIKQRIKLIKNNQVYENPKDKKIKQHNKEDKKFNTLLSIIIVLIIMLVTIIITIGVVLIMFKSIGDSCMNYITMCE